MGADRRGNAEVEITVTEGRNRLVRRMLLKVGHPVLGLRRQSFAGLTLRGMERGEVRELTAAEVQSLQAMAEGSRRKRAGRASPKM
jgi:23S rRNA pseudouridine2605 synthase